MNKPRSINWKTPAILLCLGFCAVALYVQRPQEREYQGKRLSEWLEDLDTRNPKETTESAKNALRQMGTNVVPPLLDILNAEAYYSKRQGSGVAVQPQQSQERVISAFQALGPLAIPALTNFLAGESAPAAAHALSQIIPEGLPFLVQALTNSDSALRQKIALGVESVGTNGRPLVPVLIMNLTNADYLVRAHAARALGKIALEPGLAVPVLIERLQDTNAEVRLMTAQALGEYGPQAESAILALLTTAKDKHAPVSRAAFTALKRIAPEAAAKAGVK
jgi:HEAT repeat protein